MNDNNKEIEELRAEINQLREDVGNLAGTLKDVGKSSAQSAKGKADQELDQILAQLTRTYNSAKQSGESALNSTQSEIENNPLTSLVIAFFVGLITGKLFSQK